MAPEGSLTNVGQTSALGWSLVFWSRWERKSTKTLSFGDVCGLAGQTAHQTISRLTSRSRNVQSVPEASASRTVKSGTHAMPRPRFAACMSIMFSFVVRRVGSRISGASGTAEMGHLKTFPLLTNRK